MHIKHSPGSNGDTQPKRGRVKKTMITQIEIDGFKTFKDFKVELAPFQVIVGPNGSGKSNLFDALHLLSRLADTDLLSAFQELRGDVGELFTKFPDGQTSERIRIAVEMLVDRRLRDSGEGEFELIGEVGLRKKVTLKYTRLRYELEIALQSDGPGPSQLQVAHESLKSIPQDEDNWCKKYGLSSKNDWLPESVVNQVTFIDTQLRPIAIRESIEDKSRREVVDTLMISLYPDNNGQERINRPYAIKRFYAAEVQRTVLSREADIEYPHVFAASEELRSLRFLHLNPEVLRQPSSTKSPRFLSRDGSNLPTTLARMQAEDKFALIDVSRDMANLVPGIVSIRVEQDRPSDKYVVYAETSDERSFSSQVLSDGTLRLLALAALRNDPQFHGVLCLEEPENGVHPFRLRNMVRLLREMATDFNDSEQANEPLRQVLVTTHSPAFISQPQVVNFLLFAYTATQIAPDQPTMDITRMVPVITEEEQLPSLEETGIDKAEASYTLDEVRKYLDSEAMHEALLHFGER